MSKQKTQSNAIGFERRNELHANVARACKNCGAPGVWHDIPGELNAKCYDPLRVGQIIGDVCPQCDSPREAYEPKGMIWYKRIFGSVQEEGSSVPVAKGK